MRTAPAPKTLRSDGRWPIVRLADVCELNPRRPAIERSDHAPTTFVSMSAVDENGHGISRAVERPFRDVKKGYTCFAEGDVLFAKITPCMQNGKHAIARDLIDAIGFGSTEFHVVRPHRVLLAEWLLGFLLQSRVLQDAEAHFTGAVGQQRVPTDYLANLYIPLPPLQEQKRIAARLNEQLSIVKRARAAAEERLNASKVLARAVVNAVFDLANRQKWSAVPLGEAADITSGVTLGRRLATVPVRQVPYLRVANVKDGYLALEDMKETPATEVEIKKLRLRSGDLVLTEGGDPDKLGRGTYWRGEIAECIHQNHIFRVRLSDSRYSPAFVAFQMGSSYGKAYFLAHAKRTTGIATINRTVLRRFPLLSPSLPVQERAASTIQRELDAVGGMSQTLEQELHSLERMPAALLRAAFNGDA